jgi:TonB family protein
MKSCPQCGKQYPDSEGFCEFDGTALVAAPDLPRGRPTIVMRDEASAEHGVECPVCGGKALPGETRCNYCGARLPAEGSETARPASSAQAGNSENSDSAAGSSGPQKFGEAPVYAPEAASTGKGRRFSAIVGLAGAAIVALAAGAWFALYLVSKYPSRYAKPSAAISQPTVELATQAPLRIQADTAGSMPRDADSLLTVFEHNKAGLANVYSNALSSSPSMSDGMLVRLHILPDGGVDNGAVKVSTSGNPSFDAEVIEAMTSWKFSPVSGSGVTADYRVLFAPSASAAAAVESDLDSKLASMSPNEPPEYAFSPSGAAPTAVAETTPSSMPSPAAGAAAMPSTAVAMGTPAPAAESTTMAGLEPAPPVATPGATPAEIMPVRPRVRHHRRPPQELAALPPPKPPLIERVNTELRANRKLRRVQAYTNGSVVTIFGKVFDDNDRLLAERTVRGTDGVSAVIDNLTTDTQQWQQNQTLITQALQNAGLNNVQVKVIGRSVYLSGQVKTELDRERAVTVAQAAAPVHVRENLITVAMGNIFGF